MNFRQLLTNTRIRLGEPRAQRPSDLALLLMVRTQVQSFLTQANLSDKPWAVDEVPLIAVGGVEDYDVGSASQFGKPIQVRTVWPSPNHVESTIEFFELGDINFEWDLPRDMAYGWAPDGSPNTAQRIAFFRKAGRDQVYARIMPIPQVGATYQILYQVGVYGETESLDDIPVLPQHHALVEIRAAIDALPHAEWGDDENMNREKRKELALTLAATEGRLAKEFNNYIKTATISRRIGFRDLYAID